MFQKTKKLVICFMIFFFIIIGCTSTTDSVDEQFVEVHLQFGFVNELNTFEGKFTKDLVMDGSITVDFWLSKKDQESIKELANQVSFFNLPNNIPAQPGITILPDPSPNKLRFRFDTMDHTVVWSYAGNRENTNFKKVIELSNHIISIVKNNEIYRTLPETRGSRL